MGLYIRMHSPLVLCPKDTELPLLLPLLDKLTSSFRDVTILLSDVIGARLHRPADEENESADVVVRRQTEAPPQKRRALKARRKSRL